MIIKLLIPVSIVLAMMAYSTNTMAGNAKEGKKHYQRNCAQCHGVNGVPRLPRAANLAKKEGLRVSDKSLVNRIKSGGKTCPSYSGMLRDQEIVDLVAFLRTFR